MAESRPPLVTSEEWLRHAKRGKWSVSLQGSILQVKQTGVAIPSPRPRSRGGCELYSRGSRRRLIFRVNRIDWPNSYLVKFITLTYPDELVKRPAKRRATDRYLFHRHMEKFLGRRVAMLWRTEYEVRKSGIWEGTLQPHMHMLVFASEFLPWWNVREWWRSVLAWNGTLVTEVRAARNQQQAAIYTGKYIGKAAPLSLVSVSYLNNLGGRPWGVVRPTLVPWAREQRIENIPPEVALRAWCLAQEHYRPIGESSSGGFTLLGRVARIIWEEIEAAALTAPHSARYTSEYNEGDEGR